MKNILKKVICLILCVIVLCSSLSSVALAEYETDYPKGVTVKEVYSAIQGTDTLLNNIVPTLTGQSFQDLVKTMIYNDESLSNIVVSLYLGISENLSEMQNIGLDVSVSAVANALVDYPEVYAALIEANSWEEVNLSGVKWGITDSNSFALAFAKALSPFNEVLYMLLCSGTYTISGFIKIDGANGYENAIVPMLTSLKCTDLISQEDFTAQADADRSNILKNILLPVFAMLEKSFEAPADNLSELLPAVAYFIQSGEMDACMETLLEPIYTNPLVEVAAYFKILDLDSMKIDMKGMLETGISDMSVENGFQLAPIDLEKLSQMGSQNGFEFESDKGRAFVEIMRWLIDTLKLNKDAIPQLLKNIEGHNSSFSPDLLDGLYDTDTDTILSGFILLFSPGKLNAPESMVYPDIEKTDVPLLPGSTEEDYQYALNGLDSFINAIVKESGNYSSIKEILSANIYTNKNITAVLTGVYGTLEKEGVLDLLVVLGIDATPKGVAECISTEYADIYNALNSAQSWSKASLGNISWGFEDGSRQGFQSAFVAVLRPLVPMLKIVLAEEDMVLFDSITITGTDGYNTAIIPILEALGCKESSIKTYCQYINDKDNDAVLNNIAEPVFDILDEVFENPVKTLTRILPNIVYFMNSGSLEKCISNLLIPVSAITSKLSFLPGFDSSFSELTKNIDLNTLLSGMLEGSGINIAEFDINSVAGMGTKTEKQSKSVINGKNVTYSYIEADQTDVLISLLRVVFSQLIENMDVQNIDIPTEILDGMRETDPDALLSGFVLLFSPAKLNAPESMVYPAVAQTVVQYTPNLTKDNYQKVLDEIDDLLDEFIREGGSYYSIDTLLSSSVYTNNNINALTKGIYGALEKEGVMEMLTILDVDASPKGVAQFIKYDYPKAYESLNSATSWSKVSLDNDSWGFKNGSRRGFQNAFVAVLRPLVPVLKTVLAEEDMVVFDSITITGSDGYNTGIIPILEALGCKESTIKTYSQYINDKSKDAVLNNIAEPVFDILDEVFENPVKTLTRILPNIVYFMNSGSLERCISNLLLPVSAITSKLSFAVDIDFDASQLTKNIDMNTLLSGMLEGTGMKIADFDMNALAGIGTKTEKRSKSVINGNYVTYSYIEADQTGVLMSILRVLAKTLKLPGNENLLVGTMDNGNEAFSTYSTSIGEQFAKMTEDEIIEWLYNLLFKERAQVEIVFDGDNYSPTIIYKEPPKDYTIWYVLGGFGIVAGIIGLVIFRNRKRLYY